MQLLFSIPFFIFHPSFQNNQQGASRTDVPLLVFKFLNADTRTVLYWAYLLKQTRKRELIMWLMFAVGSALFAGLTSILAKCGIRKTDSTVATAIRTIVVLIFSWAMVFLVGSQNQLGSIGGKTLLFLVLSGLATGASWLCYYRALQDGPASLVAPIDKLSILVTVLFSYVVFHEKLSRRSALGLLLLVGGTLVMLL